MGAASRCARVDTLTGRCMAAHGGLLCSSAPGSGLQWRSTAGGGRTSARVHRDKGSVLVTRGGNHLGISRDGGITLDRV